MALLTRSLLSAAKEGGGPFRSGGDVGFKAVTFFLPLNIFVVIWQGFWLWHLGSLHQEFDPFFRKKLEYVKQ